LRYDSFMLSWIVVLALGNIWNLESRKFLKGFDVLQVANETSLHRQRCADKYSKLSRDDMMCLLGDTTDELYPVYMQGTPNISFTFLR
jgi:hypothetical protein